VRKLSVVGLAVLLCASCQSLVEDLPDSGPFPTEGVTSTSPIAAFTAVPSASPTNEPGSETPKPAAPTSPPPPPPPPSGNTSCTDAPLPDGGVFMADVDAAQTAYLKAHLSLFKPVTDPTTASACFKDPGPNGKNWDDFYVGVVDILNGSGLRAIVDHGGEIAVKSNNSMSEQYHVLTSSGCIHRRPGNYRSTCTPAWF
jgi:hypothetical protein